MTQPANTRFGGASTGGKPAARLGELVMRWGGVAAALIIWEVAASAAQHPYFPQVTEMLAAINETWFFGGEGDRLLAEGFTRDLLPSLARALSGWVIAAVVGVSVGLVLGRGRVLPQLSEPTVHFLRAIPAVALIPPFMVLLGIGNTMKVSLIAVGCLWPILLNTIDGARSVDTLRMDTARVFNRSRLAIARHILLPSTAPKIFAGLRISLAISLILMVVSEMVSGGSGLGYQVLVAQRGFQIVDMWAGIVLLGVLGYVLNTLVVAVETRVMAWQT